MPKKKLTKAQVKKKYAQMGLRISEILDDKLKHLPADGSIWFTDTRNYHTVFNGGEENRIHLVATYLGEK